jgi:hypothetical protein
MADNTILPPGSGGDTIRTIDRTSDSNPIPAKTQVVAVDFGGEANESLVTSTNPMPVFDVDLDVYNETTSAEAIISIIVELRVISQLLFEGLGTRGDIDNIRQDQIAAVGGSSNAS